MRKISNGNKKLIYSQRELDVLIQEVLTNKDLNHINKKEVGFTTPYRYQADKASSILDKEIKSDTIHKYQGREKEVMIMSTVLDESSEGKRGIKFVDDPCKVNVAVSRAKNQFVLVTHNSLFNRYGSEVKALVKYIKYNALDKDIIQSEIVSVFDLLYKEYSSKLMKLDKRLFHHSRYKSNNIIDTCLYDLLEGVNKEYNEFIYNREIYLRNLIKNINILQEEERTYINNRASIDFVVYDKLDKTPVLLIEVDGVDFHENNSDQLIKDKMKENICRKCNLNLLRLPTNKQALTYIKEELNSILKV